MTIDKVLIFGAGSCGLDCLLHYANRVKVLGFIDNDVGKSEFEGYAVFSPSEISNLSYDKIIIASSYFREIYSQLKYDLNIRDQSMSFFYPNILSVDEFKSYTPIDISSSVGTATFDFSELLKMLKTLLHRSFRKYDVNNTALLSVLNEIDENDFYEIWHEFCDLILFERQYYEVFFTGSELSVVNLEKKYANKAWLPAFETNAEYSSWFELKNSNKIKNEIIFKLLVKLIETDYLSKESAENISTLLLFKDILYVHFILPKYKALQKYIFSICHEQRNNWTKPYCNSYPYQGLAQIGISGFKPSEERLKRYSIDTLLSSDSNVLDIGSNCGFLGASLAQKVGHIDLIEFNPYLCSIAETIIKELKLKNVKSILADFVTFKSERPYDVIFSLANHCTIDGNLSISFEEYIAKCFHFLVPGGYLIFESHNVFGKGMGEVGDDSDLNEKFDVIEKYFTVIKDKMINTYVPVCGVDKLFVVLQKKSQYLPRAVRTFDLSISKLKYHY